LQASNIPPCHQVRCSDRQKRAFIASCFLDLLSLRPITPLTPAAPGHVDIAFCAFFASRSGAKSSRRPLTDGGVPWCSLESTTLVSNQSLTIHPVTHPSGTESYLLQLVLSRYLSRPRIGSTSRLTVGWQSTFALIYRCCKTPTCAVSKTRTSALPLG
jgi:hypothetical protein